MQVEEDDVARSRGVARMFAEMRQRYDILPVCGRIGRVELRLARRVEQGDRPVAVGLPGAV